MTGENLSSALGLIGPEARAFIGSRPGHFIDGAWVEAPPAIDVIDPSTEVVIGSLAEAGADEVERAVAAARAAFSGGSPWRKAGPQERERLLRRLADAVEADSDVLADLISADLGLPRPAALAFEVGKVVETLRYYAGYPTKIHGTTIALDPGADGAEFLGYTTLEPVGVVGAIIPWNAPLLIAAWKLAPALAAGCTIVLKPAEDASLAVLRLAELARRVGFPPGVVNVVTGRGHSTGKTLLAAPGIDKFAFTGSTRVGKEIHAAAAERMVRLSLELGGKNPAIVMDDADVEAIAPALCMAAFGNSGQICVSGSKVVAHRAVAPRLVAAMSRFAESLPIGRALDAGTVIGPVCSQAQLDRVLAYVGLGRSEGRVAAGGGRIGRRGYFVEPTVLTDLPAESRLLREEIFGPVITVETFDEVDTVIAAANADRYGLCASLWGSHHGRLQTAAKALRTGTVFINTPAFPPAAIPAGGFRESGVGRDLGAEGLRAYLESKSVIARIN